MRRVTERDARAGFVRLAGLALCAALTVAGGARADEGSDPLRDALKEWAARSVQELRIDDGAPPHRAVFATLDEDWFEARAEFGSLLVEKGHRSRPTRVEVVVGDDTLDSSRFQSRDKLPRVVQRPSLVVDDVPLALERDLWITADHGYKAAVKQWRVKVAALAALGGEPPPPDWSPAEPVVAIDPAPVGTVDRDALRSLAVDASARLRAVDGLRHGEVRAKAMTGRYLLVTSEGTELVQPEGYAVVYAWADLQLDDGVQLFDRRQWVARTVADLPAADVIADEVEAMGRGLVARAAAEVVDYYEGPVVFEGGAAADLFRYLVSPEVCGTPPPPQADRSYQELVRSGPRIGRRLLPAGWRIVDDPTRALPGMAGTFRHDREGVPARAVELVDDGYVRDLLMSRIPRADLAVSNGHARGGVSSTWQARLSVWEVEAPKLLSARSFDRQVARALKDARLDRILVVRALQSGKGGELPRPTDLVWRYADGSEQPARSLAFQGVDRRALRGIVAAGGGTHVHPYLDAWTVTSAANGTAGLPSIAITPAAVLVEDLELVFPGPDEKPHALPPAAFE